MRRLLGCLLGAGLLTAALGCHHTAGRCDCIDDVYHQPYGTPMAPPSPAHVRPVMPPAGEKLLPPTPDTPKPDAPKPEKEEKPDKED
jgi:hypothetical protein